jgi:hypothetical protein
MSDHRDEQSQQVLEQQYPLDDSPEAHAARKEALDAVRSLVASEEQRSTNLNTRALGIISASSVVTAVAAFFAKDVWAGTALDNLDEPYRSGAVGLLIAAIACLGFAVIRGVMTLWPRARPLIVPDDLAAWTHGQPPLPSEEKVRAGILGDLAGQLIGLRQFNAKKVTRLKRTYLAYAIAVVLIAVDAVVFFVSGVWL